jgi:hypothetical protein
MRWGRTTIALGAIAAVAAGSVWLGASRWRRRTRLLRSALENDPWPDRPVRYDPGELDGLPAPVARYLGAALRDGQPVVRRAAISWRGEFNLGAPGKDNWRRFRAEQWFSTARPGFVWSARMAMAPGLTVLVRDALVRGRGSMRAAVLGLFPVANSAGTTALAIAALQRYLAEAAWFPTALLPSQGTVWTALDADRALGTIRSGELFASAEFRFGADGWIESVFVPDRLFDDGKNPPEPRPWRGRHDRYEERSGLCVPTASEVEWLLPSGAFPYWRGQPLTIDYDWPTR